MNFNHIKENSLLTYTGRIVNYKYPEPDMFHIDDIATGLSREFRFANQTPEPFSVAQHSFLVSQLVHPDYALEALLHDATEAYMKDIPSPLKSMIPEYKEIEERLMEAIAKNFGLKYPLHEDIKKADKQALVYEKAVMFAEHRPGFCWDIAMAKNKFLKRFDALTKR